MAEYEELVGKKIGKLTVIEKTSRPSNIKYGTYFLCRCECGEEIAVLRRSLVERKKLSCGCEKYADIIGHKFGKWTVLEVVEPIIRSNGRKRERVKCVCDCGSEKIISLETICSGRSLSCGCYKKEKVPVNYVDLTNKKYGHLKVVKRMEDKILPSGQHKRMWLCVCDCGNERVVEAYNLTSGVVSSCGCISYLGDKAYERYNSLMGDKYGRLTVLKRVEDKILSNNTKIPQWYCKCECGKEEVFSSKYLKRAKKPMCSACNEAFGNKQYIDIVGKKYGRLTVKGQIGDKIYESGKQMKMYLCSCECGNDIEVSRQYLKSSSNPSCNTCRKNDSSKHNLIDITGETFGRWTPLYRVEMDGVDTYWRCRCECGTEKNVNGASLRYGRTMSCGCLSAEIADGRVKELIGKRIGELDVLKEADDYISPSGAHHKQVLCKCSCGNIRTFNVSSLRNGKVNSCHGNFNDLTGKRFGKLTVENLVNQPEGRPKGIWYECKCDCGNTKLVKSAYLVAHNTTSCGNCEPTELLNKRYGHLIVLRYDRINSIKTRRQSWICKCDCGKEISLRADSLVYKNNCGCDKYNTKVKYRLTEGTRFGMLTVVSFDEELSKNKKDRMYVCRCDCGNIKSVSVNRLVGGYTNSCGCSKQSKYEMWVEDILTMYGYRYDVQIKFDALTGIGMGKLSYDFGVYNDKDDLIALIECQGEQHYRPVEYFGGKEKFEQQQLHDALKKEYAEEFLEVPLIEIPYWLKDYQDIADNINVSLFNLL